MIRYILLSSESTLEKRGVIICRIEFSTLLSNGKFFALIGLDRWRRNIFFHVSIIDNTRIQDQDIDNSL